MADVFRVDPELLVSSGGVMDDHSHNVFVTHSSADQAIESSMFSWVGQSQAALAVKAETWRTITTALTTRLYAHGEGLRVSGMAFAAMDEHDAANLAAVYRPNEGA